MQEATSGQTTPFVVGPHDGEATWFLGTRMIINATGRLHPEIDPSDFERLRALYAKYRLEEAGPPLQPLG